MTPAAVLALQPRQDAVPDRDLAPVRPPTLEDVNDLEGRIAAALDDVDAALWEQARIVKMLLDSGMGQRTLARRWINLKTMKPYSRRHVQIIAGLAGGYLTSHPRPSFRKTYNAMANAPSGRTRSRWSDLTDSERHAVRRIGVEMDVFRFVGRSFFDPGRGRGGDVGVVGGAAGARVYWDIVGGDSTSGRPIHKYTRAAVTQKLSAFITKGVRSVVADLVVDVARRRLAADRSVSRPEMSPSAGDVAGTSVWLNPRQ